MNANFTISIKLIANFSYRVARRRYSFNAAEINAQPHYGYGTVSCQSSKDDRVLKPFVSFWSERSGIMPLILWFLNHILIRWALYALSAAIAFGLFRGRPLGRPILTSLRVPSNWVESCTWPAVTRTDIGFPLPSQTRWILPPKATTGSSQAMIRRFIWFCLPSTTSSSHDWRGYAIRLYKITTSQCYHSNRLGPAGRREFALVYRLYASVHTCRKLFAMVRTFPANHAMEHRCEVSKKYHQLWVYDLSMDARDLFVPAWREPIMPHSWSDSSLDFRGHMFLYYDWYFSCLCGKYNHNFGIIRQRPSIVSQESSVHPGHSWSIRRGRLNSF